MPNLAENYRNKNKILASLGLILTTMIWGSGFVVMKHSVDIISPIYLMAYRFSIAGAAMVVFFLPKLKTIRRGDLLPGFVLGLWLSMSYVVQTYGLKYTTASNNAFITTLYVIFVPFLSRYFNRTTLRRKHIFTALLALLGIALLSLDTGFTLRLGDGLTLLCSICFAVHIIFIERYTRIHDPLHLSILQMLFAAVICWLLAPSLEGPADFSLFSAGLVLGLVYLGLFSTMLGFLLQTVGQTYLKATTASLLLSLECVFGAAFSVALLGDPMTVRIALGFLLVLGAVVWSQAGSRA